MDLTLKFFKNYLFSPKSGAVIKRISWLSILSLFVSVMALVVVLSVMTALNTNIRDRTLALEPHLVVEFPAGTPLSVIETHPAQLKLKAENDFEVLGFETQDVILRTMDGHFHGAIARGVSEASTRRLLRTVDQIARKHRQNFSQNTENSDPTLLEDSGPQMGEVDLGVELARSLGVFEGDALMVVPPEGLLLPPSEAPPFERVKVRRILATNISDLDNSYLFYRQGLALNSLRQTASRRVGLDVWMKDPNQAQSAKQSLENFAELKVETWKDRNSALFFALRMEKTVIALFLTLASLVAGFSLISVLSLLTSQKYREMGLLRALGFSEKSLVQLFARIGYLLGGVGVASGLIVGTLISLYLQFFPLHVLPDVYYDSEIPAQVEIPFLLLIMIFAGLFVWWGSWISARSAALSHPSERLRSQ